MTFYCKKEERILYLGYLVVYMRISLRQVLKKCDMSCTMNSTDSRWDVRLVLKHC